jgi:hypothetical protein
MTKFACLAALMAAFCVTAGGGCIALDECMGMRCGNNCCDQCGSCGDCDSCNSCNSCGSCGHAAHSCDRCSSCGSCNSCGSECGSSCSSGCCDSCNSCGDCGHGMSDLIWPFNCSLLHCMSQCCKAPETFDCPGGGCGEKYWCDWKSCPPTPDPCDHCGCYTGGCQCEKPCYQASPRFGSIAWPAWPPQGDPGMDGGEGYVGQKSKTTTTR